MNSPELSLKVFAGYLFAVGGLLMAVPNVFLSLFWLPPASPDTWLRVLGLVVFVLAYYYFQAAQHHLRPMMEASVRGRLFASLVFLGLVLLGLGPAQLLLFGLVDLVCALWTRQGLKATLR